MTVQRFVAAALATLSCATLAAVSFAQPPTPAPGKMAPPGKMGKMDKGKMGKMDKPGKKMPMRDSKGRFIKTPPPPAKMMGKKGGMATGAPGKKMPMRDSKGRFVKASPSPAPKMAPKPKM